MIRSHVARRVSRVKKRLAFVKTVRGWNFQHRGFRSPLPGEGSIRAIFSSNDLQIVGPGPQPEAADPMLNKMPVRMSEDMSRRMQKDMPDRASVRVPNRMPEKVSEYVRICQLNQLNQCRMS